MPRRKRLLPKVVRDPLLPLLASHRANRDLFESVSRTFVGIQGRRKRVYDPNTEQQIADSQGRIMQLVTRSRQNVNTERAIRKWWPGYAQWRVTAAGPRAIGRLVRRKANKAKKRLEK